MATLSIRRLRKSYEGPERTRGAARVSVLDGIDLEAADGEFLVLVGPSGCGKSTLLRCIAGLETIDGGEIHIGDRPVDALPPRDRDVAMVFQSYALYPHMTVRENMAFSLRIRGVAPAEIEQAVAEAASMLELNGLLDRLPRALSGGQRQRVAMGRAIVRRPAVFLFDEPLSNLDAALRAQLRIELKRLHRRLGATMVYVTHDQVEAMTLADRIAVLDRGRLMQVGTPADLYDEPRNQFVAGFLGTPSMSFLHALEPGVVVGVRPHHVILGSGPLRGELPGELHGELRGELRGEVEVAEALGFESFVHVRVGEERIVARIEGAPPAPGPVSLRMARPYRFDASSGERLPDV